MKLLNFEAEETKLKVILDEIPIKVNWLILTVLWPVVGLYIYHNILPITNWITQLVFYSITFILAWQNKEIVIYFLKNPFKQIDKPHIISSVLWVFPFTILMSTIPLILIPQALGIISSDPQNINGIKMSIDKYLIGMAFTPIGVIQEEIVNILLIVGIAKLLMLKLNTKWLLMTIVLSSMIFGGLHVFGWGLDSAIERLILHIPFLFSIIYFRNAWPCILAHAYQNGMTYTSAVIDGFETMFVGYGVLLIIIIYLYRHIVASIRNN